MDADQITPEEQPELSTYKCATRSCSARTFRTTENECPACGQPGEPVE